MNEIDIRRGEHMNESDFAPNPDGALFGLGTEQNPHRVAPAGWDEGGLPYGAWCKCSKCGFIGRSTLAFDYYADKAGDPLECESCARRNWRPTP